MAIAALVLFAALQSRTTQDGVYTETQAKRGEQIYANACSSCHAPDLSGSGQAPALADTEFANEWNNQPLSDLFGRIQATMPADAAGSLKPAEVADVMAFMFSKGRMPAGQTELPGDADALKAITFTPPKP